MTEEGIPSNASATASDAVRDAADGSSSAHRLVSRLAELRGHLDLVAPEDQERGREAVERLRGAEERIATLEDMLAAARDREQELATTVARNRRRLLDAGARISELSATASRVIEAEDARRRAEGVAERSERDGSLAREETAALQAEVDGLRRRNAELESDLASLGEEVAAAALARAEAARLKAERDQARERAHAERRLAAEDRLRAAESDLRATELQRKLRDAERRIIHLTNERPSSASDAAPEDPADRPTAPWIELQRVSVENVSDQDDHPQPALFPAAEPSVADPAAEPTAGDGSRPADDPVIDLTAEPEPAEGDGAGARASLAPRNAVPSTDGRNPSSANEWFWDLLGRRRR
jgi:chromosome segregation ATPase